MMEIDTLITFLRTSVKKNSEMAGGVKVYVFGSAVWSHSPQDVDLVIVYNSSTVNVDDVLSCRRRLQRELSDKFGLPTDICLLNEKEAQSNPFLINEGAVLIYG